MRRRSPTAAAGCEDQPDQSRLVVQRSSGVLSSTPSHPFIMTSDDQQPHLIFFDTFSRDAADATALDLIQFRSPVRIHEIRIIPLGARIAANFPNGDRLG